MSIPGGAKSSMKRVIIFLFLCSCAYAQPDPNIPVLRSYVGEPNEAIDFAFWVRDLDGDKVNVVVSGPVHWLDMPVADPNGLMVDYSGDIAFDAIGEYYLKIEADDGMEAVFAYLKFIVRRKNRAPEIL